MKKTTRSILSLCLAVIMIAAMATTAFASSGFHDEKATAADTSEVTLLKYLELIGDLTNGESKEETFKVMIEPYMVKNAPAGFGVGNMPVIGTKVENTTNTGYVTLTGFVKGGTDLGSLSTNAKGAKLEAKISIPAIQTDAVTENTFPEVGDYYYKVTEVAGTTAGVHYDSSVYFMHVQIVRVDDTPIRLVTLHTAVKNEGDSEYTLQYKTDHILNKYSNGGLTISKTVAGNSGDQSKKFGVKVTFTTPTGLYVKNDINVSGVGVILTGSATAQADYSKSGAAAMTALEAGETGWTGTKTVVMYLSHDEEAVFTNIPYDVTYTVQELDYSGDGYDVPTYKLDKDADTEELDAVEGTTWANKQAKGKISDLEDEVSITNNKDTSIDVGVILEDAPFVMLIAVSVAALGAFLVIRRKREI